MVTVWQMVAMFVIFSVTTAAIKGFKWLMLYRIIKRAMGDFKMPKIDLGGVLNGNEQKQ